MNISPELSDSSMNIEKQKNAFDIFDLNQRFGEALREDVLSGPFSLIDDDPIYIDVSRGRTVKVHCGSLWLKHPGVTGYALLGTGETYHCEKAGLLMIFTAKYAEVQLV